MRNMIRKLLGLDTLDKDYLDCCVRLGELEKENELLQSRIKNLDDEVKALESRVQEKIDAIEEIDTDDFVREDDVNDRIESYINDNDIATQSYVDNEIESKVSDAVESAVEDIDLTDKVKQVVDDMDKASFGDTEEIQSEVRKALANIVNKVYDQIKKS